MRVRPLHGYRYGIGRVVDVSDVVAPPYDQITPEIQEQLYAMSPANIVRVSLPRAAPEPGEPADPYARARRTLDAWLADGVWQREEWPAIYPYHQTYRVGGATVTRAGVVALGQVTDYAQGIVRPHERTHRGPKEDRLRHLEATGADVGLLFMLTSDPEGALARAIEPVGDPVAEARDLRGERHRLWRVTDTDTIARVEALMATATCIIADGHHRYETAVTYARRHPGRDDKLMAFFPLEAPGMTILPNHRCVRDVPGFALARLLDDARAWFDVAPLDDPEAFRPTNRRLGVVAGGDAATLTLRDDAFARLPWPPGTSPAWRSLAVSILHAGILRPLLGITDDHLDARTHVDYTADQAEAVRWARSGRCQAAFLIAPTTPAELQAVVSGGEVLPQKSTHFYPKLLDGLVFHRVAE
ncbi:MAG TPA: DUF1015 domain-containing protein [Candidatus Tectomicrobia bacterium]|nr:DUF1015 domain-containing protein [Candidatus Tectomicrobia bacterium]